MDYKKVNRESWNNQVTIHFESDFYDVPAFIAGKNSLNPPELELLRDVSGKSILHLQCHFGQDSISLSRMGAKVTGVDLSDAGIEQARKLNDVCGTDAEFIVSSRKVVNSFSRNFIRWFGCSMIIMIQFFTAISNRIRSLKHTAEHMHKKIPMSNSSTSLGIMVWRK